ncbi:pyridoxal phosphate [Plasmopara halstedii]|uniref:Pyridoxal phosphate n=1 Tax=Plasmopara halstedii TaxID=4781 RepID=A0A0N7L4K0_PLAHL|nr:pyridoxal phosphate [Plasmopara halstedii]CEG38891.1 pyridoxal phosphate [Plasmopara halstedii]|eukprot:XP_024575260.1 pyridoxal phosphate [Plasmopara halstedii]
MFDHHDPARRAIINTVSSSILRRDTDNLLILFDFNDSLVDTNSDVFLFKELHPELCQSIAERYAQKPIWPKVVDEMLQILMNEKPHVTLELIRDTIAAIPVQAQMMAAIRMVVERFHADVKIISDGNTFYINSFLAFQELQKHVIEVFANPFELENRDNTSSRLRIRPYHSDHLQPHECSWCPANMCKGSIVDEIRRQKSYSRIVYVGDGTGDFCPASRLFENDIVLARSRLVGEPYGLQRRIDENPGVLHANVVSWSTGNDIYRYLIQFCQRPYEQIQLNPRTSSKVLVIFDYDWSLINENSDTYIFQKLHPDLLATLHDRRKIEQSWTQIMDDMLRQLAIDKPEISPDMIRATVSRVPIQSQMLDALRLAAEHYHAHVKIVSDANSVYIESMLTHHHLEQSPSTSWIYPYTTVLYVGDGSGDFCAATRLTKNDVVFARENEANGHSFGLIDRIDQYPTMVKAAVVPWSTGEDIYRHFARYLLGEPLYKMIDAHENKARIYLFNEHVIDIEKA